jgi:hypothetical protein
VVALVATAVVLGLLAYLLPGLLATRSVSSNSRESVGDREPTLEGSAGCSFEPARAIEQRLCRCDVCDHTFVLSFERRLPADKAGDTTVCAVWVRCGRASCRHVQAVLVPMGSWNHKTDEWLGRDEPAFAQPSVREMQKVLTSSEDPGGRPTRG